MTRAERKHVFESRDDAVFAAIRAHGVATLEQAWAAARAQGATRIETRASIHRLLSAKRIEVVQRGNRSGTVSTYRAKAQ
jgi:hypothetical protein